MTLSRAWALSLAVATVGFVPRAAAEPSTVDRCVDEHESAQRLRRAGELLASREALAICAEPSCPSLIERDCAQWRLEVDGLIPSLVFAAKNEEGDLVDVAVTVDGRLVATKLDGASIEVDPGSHEVVFERPGSPPIVRRVVVGRGVKDRLVSVFFAETEASSSALTTAPQAMVTHRPVPVGSFVAGGMAIATLGVAIGLGTHAMAVKTAKVEACAPLCGENDKAEVTRFAIAADVLFGASALAAGTALVLFLVRPEVPLEEEPALSLGVDASGGWLGLRGRF